MDSTSRQEEDPLRKLACLFLKPYLAEGNCRTARNGRSEQRNRRDHNQPWTRHAYNKATTKSGTAAHNRTNNVYGVHSYLQLMS